jgi:hypothetical protein
VPVSATYARHRYAVLFYSLLVSMAVAPLLRPLGFGGDTVDLLLAANLVAAVLAVGERPQRRIALAIVGSVLLARLIAELFNAHAITNGSRALWSILALLAVANGLRFALRGRTVSGEQIYAALSAYLLAGFFFGQLYWVLEQFWPGSIVVGGSAAPGSVSTTIYFSFVTLASLGYGDVLPISDPARGLAMAEVVGGQLYLAVMVARLVGAWRSR